MEARARSLGTATPPFAVLLMIGSCIVAAYQLCASRQERALLEIATTTSCSYGQCRLGRSRRAATITMSSQNKRAVPVDDADEKPAATEEQQLVADRANERGVEPSSFGTGNGGRRALTHRARSDNELAEIEDRAHRRSRVSGCRILIAMRICESQFTG